MTSPLPLQVLVEELSAEFALRALLPNIVPGVEHEVFVFRGKPDLLRKLPQRLAGYAAWPGPAHTRLVVLVDRDGDGCRQLRARLDSMATEVGFRASGTARTVVNRIAIEELEAWFFGDIEAVAAAYPRVPVSTTSRSGFRDPDAIRGGTAEKLERLLHDHGSHRGGLAKVRAAQEIAPHMNVDSNSSRSFQVFRDGLRQLTRIGGA